MTPLPTQAIGVYKASDVITQAFTDSEQGPEILLVHICLEAPLLRRSSDDIQVPAQRIEFANGALQELELSIGQWGEGAQM
jgi:hypothetical protein